MKGNKAMMTILVLGMIISGVMFQGVLILSHHSGRKAADRYFLNAQKLRYTGEKIASVAFQKSATFIA